MKDLAVKLRAMQEAGQEEAHNDADAKYAERQLDFWPDDTRVAPNSVIRSALFRSGSLKPNGRRFLRKELVASYGNTEVYFTGEELDQRDLDTWMAVFHVLRECQIGSCAFVSTNHLLELMGLQSSGQAHKAVHDRLERLVSSTVRIVSSEVGNHAAFMGPLLQEAERSSDGETWRVQLSPRLMALIDHGMTWIDWKVRHRLSRKTLAQALYAFFRSHKEPLPLSISQIYELTASATKSSTSFRQAVKKAMASVQEACAAEGICMEWAYCSKSDRISVKWITRGRKRATLPRAR